MSDSNVDSAPAVKMPGDLAPKTEGADPEALSPAEQDQRLKILHLLETFPYISRAMIQVGLGPALPPKLWDPILANLVETKEICFVEVNVTTPSGRSLVKGIYHLPSFSYPPLKLQVSAPEEATIEAPIPAEQSA